MDRKIEDAQRQKMLASSAPTGAKAAGEAEGEGGDGVGDGAVGGESLVGADGVATGGGGTSARVPSTARVVFDAAAGGGRPGTPPVTELLSE